MNNLFSNLKDGFKELWNAINDESFQKTTSQKREEKHHSTNDITGMSTTDHSKKSPIIGTINTFLEHQQFKQNQKLREEQNTPLGVNEYFISLFYFLIEQSNLITGIDFKTRLQNECNKKTVQMNEWRKYKGYPPLIPSSPDFIESLNITLHTNPAFVNEILQDKGYISLLKQNRYEVTFKYQLSGKEKEALGDMEIITRKFNENFQNSNGYSKNGIIYCHETIFEEKKSLVFHLIHYGKWQAPYNMQNEELGIEMKSNNSSTIDVLHDYENNNIISINLKEIPHYLICGESGSGKTFFATALVASICKHINNAQLYIFDFKGDETLTQYKHHKRYYVYKECQEGLENLYSLFSERLESKISDTSPIIIYFDELASYINSFAKRADKEAQQKIIAEILMMGRSKGFHLITSTQRPDAELFKLGSRNNYSFRYLMGASCSNSDVQRMMFDNTDTEFRACKQGSGFVTINGSAPILASVPMIENPLNMYSILDRALANGSSLASLL